MVWPFSENKIKKANSKAKVTEEERNTQQLLEEARIRRIEIEAEERRADEELRKAHENERINAIIEERLQEENEKRKSKELKKQLAQRDALEREKELYKEARKTERDLMFTVVELQNKMHDITLKNLKDRETERTKQMEAEISFQKQQMELMRADYTKSRESFLEHIRQKPQNDIVTSEDMEEIVRKAKADLDLDTIKFYNFAIVGHVKTGKSTLINAIRGIRSKDPNAAKVDDVECTHKIEFFTYANPELSHVRFYDVPGAGTITHNSESYYNDKCLCAFDCLIIVTQDALGQDEINFALQALKYKQPIAFVRSKMDTVLHNALLADEIEEEDQATANLYIKNMNAAFVKEIERVQKPELTKVPCFFISAHSLRKIMNNELRESEAAFQEHLFLEYIKSRSIFSRNTVGVTAQDNNFTFLS